MSIDLESENPLPDSVIIEEKIRLKYGCRCAICLNFFVEGSAHDRALRFIHPAGTTQVRI